MVNANPARELVQVQKDFIKGQRAAERRRVLLGELFEAGVSQAELADILSRASASMGGEVVTTNSVQKVIEKNRRRAERNGHQ